MVFAVEGFVEAVGPGMAVVPVHVAGDGEIWVSGRGVCEVTDEGVDVRSVGGEPAWVEGADDGTGEDEVSVASEMLALNTEKVWERGTYWK